MKTNRLTKYFTSAPALAVVFGLAGGSAIAQETVSPLTALDDARANLVEKLMPQTALISHSPKKTPGSPQPEGESGLGSGYIVDAQNCLVVTNNHVGGLAAVDADITIVLSGDPKKSTRPLLSDTIHKQTFRF